MYFEIYAPKKLTIETDNMRDIEKINCVDKRIFYRGLMLAEYDTVERAAKVLEKLFAKFKSGVDFYKLSRK